MVEEGIALLGMDLISNLHLCINADTITTSDATAATPVLSTATTEPLITPPPEIGCVKQFVHKIKVDPIVQPVCQKLRRLPFTVRAAVSAELDHLLQAGIMKEIDASAWVSQEKRMEAYECAQTLVNQTKVVVTD